MLNALLPETKVPVHRHEDTTETVICLCGKLDEVIYEKLFYLKIVHLDSHMVWMCKLYLVRWNIEKYNAFTPVPLRQNMVAKSLKGHGIL